MPRPPDPAVLDRIAPSQDRERHRAEARKHAAKIHEQAMVLRAAIDAARHDFRLEDILNGYAWEDADAYLGALTPHPDAEARAMEMWDADARDREAA